MKGGKRCRMHGGKSTTRGLANVNAKHLRHSKFLPERMLQSYMHAQEDQDLISLRAELAVLDARLDDLLSRVDTGEAGRIWREAIVAWHEFQRARGGDDVGRLMAAEQRLDQLLDEGLQDYAAWTEVEQVINLRRRVAAEERRRLVDLKQMMTFEQGMALAAALMEAVRSSVTDRQTQIEVQEKFTLLIGRAA